MAEHEVVSQMEFATLDDFIKGSNNYYTHFLGDAAWGKRFTPHFKRFQEAYPEMEREVTAATDRAYNLWVEDSKERAKLPYEQLWETYKIMSKLVFVDDKYIMRDGKPDSWFLCR